MEGEQVEGTDNAGSVLLKQSHRLSDLVSDSKPKTPVILAAFTKEVHNLQQDSSDSKYDKNRFW